MRAGAALSPRLDRTHRRSGLPLLAVDGDLTGFVLPGGNQDVILEFQPADFLLGRNITLAALLFVMAAFGTNLIFSRSTTSNRRPKEI